MIKFKIIRSGQGGRIPSKYKVCWDCGERLTKYRFDVVAVPPVSMFEAPQKDRRERICPMCVLVGYFNMRAPWWKRWFKPYTKADLIEITKAMPWHADYVETRTDGAPPVTHTGGNSDKGVSSENS